MTRRASPRTRGSGRSRHGATRGGLDFFYAYGFHAVRLDQMLDGTALTKTTFYHHFETNPHVESIAVLLPRVKRDKNARGS